MAVKSIKAPKEKESTDRQVYDDEQAVVTITQLDDMAKAVCDHADRKAGIKRPPRK